MMTSSAGNIFRVTGHLCGEFTGFFLPMNSPHKGNWRGALMFSLIGTWINDWVNNRKPGDLRRNCAHYDVTVMGPIQQVCFTEEKVFLLLDFVWCDDVQSISTTTLNFSIVHFDPSEIKLNHNYGVALFVSPICVRCHLPQQNWRPFLANNAKINQSKMNAEHWRLTGIGIPMKLSRSWDHPIFILRIQYLKTGPLRLSGRGWF